MIIKKSVVLSGLDLRMRAALLVADAVYREFGQELVITSGLDGTHSAGSFHYYGLAIDLRTRYFSNDKKREVFQKLKLKLGQSFLVIFEITHFHIQVVL